MNMWKIRIASILFIIVAIFYFSWLVQVLNTQVLWLSLPFFAANLYTSGFVCITIINNWHRSVPKLLKLPEGLEPRVAVLIPTYGEPVDMLQRTIESLLHQQWPHEKLVVVVGDDSRRPEVRSMVENLQRYYAPIKLIYHLPPPKNTPQRMGNAKAGNLNSMFRLILMYYSDVEFVETRDADDLVGDANFLRYTIGHLLGNPTTAYVQTIKEPHVSPGDPFGNRQSFFYRGLMFSKHAANAVFPCGSGLVWRKEHLSKIGGFPTWNIVEDLYSGYLAMQHGFKNSYVPIVGAIGQVAPEDIPNVYKQLGTWALDTSRLFIWKNPWFVKGLTFKQRLHFTENGLFYFLSVPLLILLITPTLSLLFGIHPLLSDNISYLTHTCLYALMLEILFLCLGDKIPFEDLWRSRQMCYGMLFVYIKACFLALIYGPHRKPEYKVTRKNQKIGLYFRETLPQTLLFLLLLISVIYSIEVHQYILEDSDLGSVFWALLYMLILSGIITKSWYGIEKKWSGRTLLPQWEWLRKGRPLALPRSNAIQSEPLWLLNTSILSVQRFNSVENRPLWLVDTVLLPIPRPGYVKREFVVNPKISPVIKRQFITIPTTPMLYSIEQETTRLRATFIP